MFFAPSKFGHVFYESSARDGHKDVFSPIRAERIDWIQATLEHPNGTLFQGWNKDARDYDGTRRVAIIFEDFVVVVAMGLTRDSALKANFVTCYQADNSIGKIRASPEWTRVDESGLSAFAGRRVVNRRLKKKWPLIRYAGPAAETSIGSKPIGSELTADGTRGPGIVKDPWR